VVPPIPGTGRIAHLEENVAAGLELTAEHQRRLEALG
jgi:aryl-alcohol dehydrogenase-like predicted oxidoreductase